MNDLEIKKALFETCYFYEEAGNRLHCSGHKQLSQKFFDMREGVIAVITLLHLDEQYDMWKCMKECEK